MALSCVREIVILDKCQRSRIRHGIQTAILQHIPMKIVLSSFSCGKWSEYVAKRSAHTDLTRAGDAHFWAAYVKLRYAEHEKPW